MKNLKHRSATLIILVALFTLSSCKKGKDAENGPDSSSNFAY